MCSPMTSGSHSPHSALPPLPSPSRFQRIGTDHRPKCRLNRHRGHFHTESTSMDRGNYTECSLHRSERMNASSTGHHVASPSNDRRPNEWFVEIQSIRSSIGTVPSGRFPRAVSRSNDPARSLTIALRIAASTKLNRPRSEGLSEEWVPSRERSFYAKALCEHRLPHSSSTISRSLTGRQRADSLLTEPRRLDH